MQFKVSLLFFAVLFSGACSSSLIEENPDGSFEYFDRLPSLSKAIDPSHLIVSALRVARTLNLSFFFSQAHARDLIFV